MNHFLRARGNLSPNIGHDTCWILVPYVNMENYRSSSPNIALDLL